MQVSAADAAVCKTQTLIYRIPFKNLQCAGHTSSLQAKQDYRIDM